MTSYYRPLGDQPDRDYFGLNPFESTPENNWKNKNIVDDIVEKYGFCVLLSFLLSKYKMNIHQLKTQIEKDKGLYKIRYNKWSLMIT